MVLVCRGELSHLDWSDNMFLIYSLVLDNGDRVVL